MRQRETRHETGFVRWLDTYALWRAIKIYRHGWPDRLVIGPGPVFFFIEFKRDAREDLREKQKHVRAFLQRLGFKVYVCRSAEEAKNKTRKYF
jgi:hypothetical protein